jgi:RNA polymerase sigma-70 factor (ECF subfamily)
MMMRAARRRSRVVQGGKTGTMAVGADDDPERIRRFRDAALPHLDDVYTLARYLLRNGADADDAVQECYLRALRHFDTFRGGAVKPWLLAILRNVCRATYAQRKDGEQPADLNEEAEPVWSEAPETPEDQVLRRLDGDAIRGLVAALPEPFREAIVLREISDLSYREIADIIGAPVGTVMSRLARARALLREAWLLYEKEGRPQ